MGHLPKLIADLALILGAGAITTLLFRRLKQPLVLGYIIAGFLVGPYVSVVPTVVDNANVKTLAEIGVIFLLFSLGLEFSFKKLLRVGGASSITAIVEIVAILLLGYMVGRWMGWSTMDSMFLGGLLASSSTTIIIRAFEELGVKRQQFARIVFGVLIVEDIVVILLMVLLSTMAVSQQFDGTEMLASLLKLLFFLTVWFIAGIFLLPTFLRRAKKLLDEETLLILSIGLCLGMVVLATQIGFSAELGAFVMGSILAETTSAEKIEHLFKPVKDLFGSVFFVSVGMMINPQAMVEHGWAIFWVTLLTIFGKLFATTLGALLSGQPLKQSLQVGMSMAQIGEFAFIVATLGITLGVTSDFLFPVAVGASAITTFTTPYFIKLSEPFYNLLVKILPPRLLNFINRYSSGAQNIQAESEWKIVLKSYAVIIATNAIVIVALSMLSFTFLFPFLETKIDNPSLNRALVLIVTLGVSMPFFWAMMARKPNNSAYKALWLDSKYNHGPLVVLEVFRVVIAIFFVGFMVDRLYSGVIAFFLVTPIAAIVLFIFSKKIQGFYDRIHSRFLDNLNEREVEEASAQVMPVSNGSSDSALSPWDAHMADFIVNANAPFVGKKLYELAWREKYGINIAYVKRGEKIIYAPNAQERLYPLDELGIIGTDQQLQLFKPVIEETEPLVEVLSEDTDNISLQKIVVDEHTLLKGKTIRESGIREKTHGLVVGIERDGKRILNPDSQTVFEWNDIVWIVGDRRRIQELVNP
ncbi:MAG: cation:proton antiporter [Chitinophagaceae bacterium]|nr:cation:proton antiporter [Chitinophagaceae bacterium]MCW5929350.1 cation:proton antiporter [Chitinophagaceae bacterium]